MNRFRRQGRVRLQRPDLRLRGLGQSRRDRPDESHANSAAKRFERGHVDVDQRRASGREAKEGKGPGHAAGW